MIFVDILGKHRIQFVLATRFGSPFYILEHAALDFRPPRRVLFP
jgi:hypothetical protein